jgi:murein DD-endopeptidase MepM/ murein hydrolase activator NlpD
MMHRIAVLLALLGTFLALGAQAESESAADDVRLLATRRLVIPVVGVTRSNLRDTFDERRGAIRHEAIDIAAPRGTPVVAAGDGRVVKLFKSAPGGLTVYQFDADEKFAYYYAHLDRYAEGLAEGTMLKRGDPLGYVGSTGNARLGAPHLHFAIFRLGPDRSWWKGTAINPYPFLDH